MTGEAAGDSDLSERYRLAADQSLGLGEAQLQKVAMRRLSRRRAEHPQKMPSTVTRFCSEGRKIDGLAQISAHAIQHAAYQATRQGRHFRKGRLFLRPRGKQQPQSERGRQGVDVKASAAAGRLGFLEQKKQQIAQVCIVRPA